MGKNRPVAGHECFAYYDSANSTTEPTWVEIKQVQDLNQPDAIDEVEASARSSKRKRFIGGLEDASIDFDYLVIQGGEDEVFNLLLDRFHTRAPIHVAIADGPIATVGTTFLRDWYIITKFEEKEGLNGSVVRSTTLKPTIHITAGNVDEYSYQTVD